MKNSALAITAPIVAALLAILTVSAVILWDADSTEVGKAFTSTPEFLFWLLVLAAQAAVWLVALPYVVATAWRRGRTLRAAGKLDRQAVASLGVAALALVATAMAPVLYSRTAADDPSRRVPVDEAWPLPDHMLRVQPLVVVAVLVGVLAVVGIWLAGIALREMSSEASAPNLSRFVELRNELNTLLAIAGVIIGLGTLASGLLREAVLATNEIVLETPPEEDAQPSVPADDPATRDVEPGYLLALEFDVQYIAVYGLFFTVLLAVAFAPSFLALRAAGANLRDRTLPLPAPTDTSFDDVDRRRKALDELLQTRLSALASFKAAIAILSPLAGSVAALLVDLPT